MSFLIENLLKPDVDRGDRKQGTTKIIPAFTKTDLKSIELVDDGELEYSSEEDVSETKYSLEGDDTGSIQDQSLKRRTLFTRQQTWQLEQTFRRQPYLTPQQCKALAEKINVTPTQIKIWFQNHRYKVKKCMKDAIQRAQYEHELRELHKYARPYIRPYSGYSSTASQSSSSYSRSYHNHHYHHHHNGGINNNQTASPRCYYESTNKLSSSPPVLRSRISPNSEYEASSNRTISYSCRCQACCKGSSSSK